MDRRSAIRRVAGAFGTLALWEAGADAARPPSARPYGVESAQLAIHLNEKGEITDMILQPQGGKKVTARVTGGTVLAECTARQITARKLAAGGVEFSKVLTHRREDHSCRLTERFQPTESGSIRWEIEILGDGSPWSTWTASGWIGSTRAS